MLLHASVVVLILVHHVVGPIQLPSGWTAGTFSPYYDAHEFYIDTQWHGLVYPMIRHSNFTNVLELASGACRNTEKLALLADHILVTDIDPEAITRCKHRFQGRVNLTKLHFVVVNSTTDLPCPTGSVSFVYQFDAGVHFGEDIVEKHVHEMSRVLMPGGTGFYHYSNLHASRAIPADRTLSNDVFQNPQSRANMSRAKFEIFAQEAGLSMLCNPVVDWEWRSEIDAFALFRKPGGLPYASEDWACPLRLGWRSQATEWAFWTSGGVRRFIRTPKHRRFLRCAHHIGEFGCEAFLCENTSTRPTIDWSTVWGRRPPLLSSHDLPR